MYKSELYFIYFEMKQFSSVLPFELSICQSVEFDVCIWPQISCFNIWNIKEIEVIFATHDMNFIKGMHHFDNTINIYDFLWKEHTIKVFYFYPST